MHFRNVYEETFKFIYCGSKLNTWKVIGVSKSVGIPITNLRCNKLMITFLDLRLSFSFEAELVYVSVYVHIVGPSRYRCVTYSKKLAWLLR